MSKCEKCGKRAYTPKRIETVGQAQEYLTARGWTFDVETWTSDYGRYRQEATHWFCPKHTWESL